MLTLHRLSPSYRLLYTFVLLFMTAGTAAHSVHQELRAGLAPREVAAWYRGNEEQPDAAVFPFPVSALAICVVNFVIVRRPQRLIVC